MDEAGLLRAFGAMALVLMDFILTTVLGRGEAFRAGTLPAALPLASLSESRAGFN